MSKRKISVISRIVAKSFRSSRSALALSDWADLKMTYEWPADRDTRLEQALLPLTTDR